MNQPHDSYFNNADSPLLPGIEDFLQNLGINSMDSDFAALREEVRKAIGSREDYSSHAPARWEDEYIQAKVTTGARVLDLGCGDGELLVRLAFSKHASVQGVEADENQVIHAIERGIPVFHEDIEKALNLLPDKSFDFAVLENTLQTLVHPLRTLEEMLRVAHVGIVSFPNFAHWSVRLAFSLSGHMPVTSSLPFTWYDTPNIHLCSISDFLEWTRDAHVDITTAYVLEKGSIVPFNPSTHNINAEQALFFIRRNC